MGNIEPSIEPETISRAPLDIRSVSLAALAGIGIVLFLRFAQEVFVPLAIGVLISYALAPIVSWLKKWSIPRTVGAGFGIFSLIDAVVAVLEKLPAAAKKLGESLKVTRGDGQGLMQKMQRAATEMENTTTEAVGPDAIRKGVTRVQVEGKPINLGDYFWQGGTKVISVGSAVVLVLVYFMLITGDLFTRKVMKIAGPSVLSRKITAQILAGLAFVIMSVEGFLLTPWLTMRAVRMNGVALFLGLMFWGWMWGVWGLLLAVPMMVMIKSICDRVQDLKPIGELLGD